jgi:RNA polymerase sigma-70 factor (ECF subfamily)
VIRSAPPAHEVDVETAQQRVPDIAEMGAAAGVDAGRDARITAIVRTNHDFIWRLLRRLGIPDASADDATQQVFCVAARRIDDIAPGRERSFLFGTALRVVSDFRRSALRCETPDDGMSERSDPGPSPEELVDKQRARALLDEILAAMPLELRTVLVLFELEQMKKSEVAELLGVPMGTAASRLRRARVDFKARVQRHLAHGNAKKGRP